MNETLARLLDAAREDGLLREELGFRGLIITDALGMNGFCSWADYDQRMLDCFNAGRICSSGRKQNAFLC